MSAYHRHYELGRPLDDAWEVLPAKGWTFRATGDGARLGCSDGVKGDTYQRCCCLPGDRIAVELGPESSGRLRLAILAGFEYARLEVDMASGELTIRTHEFHKAQPRATARVKPGFKRLELVRRPSALAGLPYEGCDLDVVVDGQVAAAVHEVDLLPECLAMLGLEGPGEVVLRTWTIDGPARPRPEYVHAGLWQQSARPVLAANVEALIRGVREAAEAGVELLVTPETSLTGLRIGDPDLDDRAAIAAALEQFQRAVAATPGAPFTLIGYPDWIAGNQVPGATLAQVKINCHRFVRPDGTLGPAMAKVHSCEEGLWHGRRYHLQRVAGVEVATGVCHDGRYPDVWSTGVMGGARLCLHPAAGGQPRGRIETIRTAMANAGQNLDAWWIHVNAGGGSAIVYPCRNARITQTLVALPPDLTQANPSWPEYAPMGDQLAHARIRLYDATGCYPMRTLRNGPEAYRLWSQLMPPVVEV